MLRACLAQLWLYLAITAALGAVNRSLTRRPFWPYLHLLLMGNIAILLLEQLWHYVTMYVVLLATTD